MQRGSQNIQTFFPRHLRPGTLIVVEGLDGSGKSTQAHIIQKYLEAAGIFCEFSAWNSAENVRVISKTIKKKDLALPAPTFDYLMAADACERFATKLQSFLDAGMTVICDRYMYTAFARGFARGLDPASIRPMYEMLLPKPDLAFYFRVPVEVALQRAKERADLKHYEAGCDMGLSSNIFESFALFQGRVVDMYDRLASRGDMITIDATLPVYAITPSVLPHVRAYYARKYDLALDAKIPVWVK